MDDVGGPFGHQCQLLGRAIPEHREARLVPDLIGADPARVSLDDGRDERVPRVEAPGRGGSAGDGVVTRLDTGGVPGRRCAEYEEHVADPVTLGHLQGGVECASSCRRPAPPRPVTNWCRHPIGAARRRGRCCRARPLPGRRRRGGR